MGGGVVGFCLQLGKFGVQFPSRICLAMCLESAITIALLSELFMSHWFTLQFGQGLPWFILSDVWISPHVHCEIWEDRQ
jgi:hypothetical protein